MTAPHWIDTPTRYEELLTALHTAPQIAIDTEFDRASTYAPQLGLIQLATPSDIYLLDPLALPNLTELGTQLARSPRCLLHACGEDLEVLQPALGQLPQHIGDTQIAAGFAQLGYPLSLQNLTLLELGINLPKEQTRSDWLRRPLTPEQIQYAANDVRYLATLHDQLLAKLQTLGYLEPYQQECEMLALTRQEASLEQAWQRFRGAWQLTTKSFTLLQKLASWREHTARTHNQPRSWILKDHNLFTIAEKHPKNLDTVANDFPSETLERWHDELLTCLHSAREPDALEQGRQQLAALKIHHNQAQIIKKRLRALAEQQQLVYELLAPKRVINDLISAAQQDPTQTLPASLCGWRAAQLGEHLAAILTELRSKQ